LRKSVLKGKDVERTSEKDIVELFSSPQGEC
jgi:hypothetical protein